MSDIYQMRAVDNPVHPVHSWYVDHKNRLTRMALLLGYQRDEADDFVNQFFLDLLEKHIDTTAVTNPEAYLYTAFKRKLIDHYRRSKTKLYVVTDDVEAHHSGREKNVQDVIEQAECTAELVSRLHKAYLTLPERCKKVLYLKFYKNLTTEQIAHQTGLSKRSVYNNLFEGIKILRSEMGHSSSGNQHAVVLSVLPLLLANLVSCVETALKNIT